MSLDAIRRGFNAVTNTLITFVLGRDYINNILHKVCSNGDIKLINYFLEQGGQIDGECFIRACGAGKKDIAELIFNNVGLHPKTCTLAMIEAIEHDHIEIVEWLSAFSGNYTSHACHVIRSLIKHKQIKIFNRLIDTRQLNSYTGFLISAYFGSVEFCELLISKGSAEYNEGFIQACSGGHIEAIKFFLEKGDCTIADGLLEAWVNNHNEALMFLIKTLGHIPSFIDNLTPNDIYYLYKTRVQPSIRYKQNYKNLKHRDMITISSLSGLLIPEMSEIIISY